LVIISNPLAVTFPTAPHTEVTAKGDIIYSEVVRENIWKLEAYVEEMASSDTVSGSVNTQKVQDGVLKLWMVVRSQPGISTEQKNCIKALYEGVVRSLRKTPETHRSIGRKTAARETRQHREKKHVDFRHVALQYRSFQRTISHLFVDTSSHMLSVPRCVAVQ
jgi:hypothetical protein